MYRDTASRLLFVLLLLAVAWSAVRIVAPFVAGLTWAAVLVVTFRPFHRRLQRAAGDRQWVATTLLTLVVAAFVVVPVSLVAVQAVNGAVAGFDWVQQHYAGTASGPALTAQWPWLADLAERVQSRVGLANVDLRSVAMTAVQRLASFLATAGPALVGGALGFAFSFLVMIVGIPLLFAKGEAMSEALASALPVPLADGRRMLQDIGDMTRSVFTSVGLTAAVQAVLGIIGFLVVGVPRAGTLGALMFFLALVPGGVALVWAPVAIWLAAGGYTWSAVFMVFWGGGVVGTSDNILRPLLAGRGVKLDGATLFFGMVGGMVAFGLVGLFLGPIVLYTFRELVDILRRDVYGHATTTSSADAVSASVV
jgi:predicted PurR-regulated permease PerM